MPSDALTKQQLSSLVDEMKKHCMLPAKIHTEKEAIELTDKDPFGRIWKVGEEYYVHNALYRRYYIPA